MTQEHPQPRGAVDERNDIPTRQNEPRVQTFLAAARFNFDRAMNVARWEVMLSAIIPVVLTAVTLFYDDFASAAAIYGLALAVIEPMVFDRTRRQLQEAGAKCQEQFDCEAFTLPLNEALTGRMVDLEDAQEAAHLYRGRAAAETALRDWYSPVVGQLPLGIARIACQRISCRWDAVARRRYLTCIGWAATGMALATVLWHVVGGRTTTQLVLTFAAVAPIVRWLLSEFIRHGDSIQVNAELKARAEDVWARALARRMSDSQLRRESRSLQDAIFLRRKSDPAVFRWVHQWLRSGLEARMHETMDEMVKRYEASPAGRAQSSPADHRDPPIHGVER